MNKYLMILMWMGLGAGIGYFAGERRGKKIGAIETESRLHEMRIREIEEEKKKREEAKEVNKEDIQKKAEDLGYVPEVFKELNDPEIKEKGEAEHPSEDIDEDEDFFGEATYVSAESYYDNPHHHDQEPLVYYEDDEVLANDETGEVIENPKAILGEGWYEALCEQRGPLYVRNNYMRMDYEVQRVYASYAKVVLGIDS